MVAMAKYLMVKYHYKIEGGKNTHAQTWEKQTFRLHVFSFQNQHLIQTNSTVRQV